MGRRSHTPSRVMRGWLTTLERTSEVRVALSYRSDDPYAITAQIQAGHGATARRWVFARDLLFEGMSASRDHPAGPDRVRVWPNTVDGVQKVNIAFVSETICLVELARTDVLGFLVDTLQVVPTGSESRFLDIESGLRRLLA